MKEAYVTFEVAKLLKEKGFDWTVDTYYCDDSNYVQHDIIEYRKENYNSHKLHISAPTQQMVCRWLRERGIHIMETIGCDVDRTPRIFYGAVIALFNDYGDIDYRNPLDENGYDSPEDAVEAAIQYVLTNLI